MREQGDNPAALRRAEDELRERVRDHRLRNGADSLPEDRLQTLFAGEATRVADATILAELLGPMLAGRAVAPAGFGTDRENARAERRPAAGPAPEIADLLDDMLAAERRGGGRRQ